ncbi:hypothetical protein [Pseudomonas sp. NA-150]|uniref:hypothetical protein n=1 Tax=Pseudomonas sp. NA-150 TaxID=3367525 RepID=UPI0037CA77F4
MNPVPLVARRRWLLRVVVALIAVNATYLMVQVLWDEPEIALEMGGTYEDMSSQSTARFSPLIRGHIWFGVPKTDARLRFIDTQYGFVTPAARFFTVNFDDNIIDGIRISPQVEPLLLEGALKVVLDLQDQWRSGGWAVLYPKDNPPFADTPEWRARIRDANNGEITYWQAGYKYQILLGMSRFKDSKRPQEERYLITLGLGKPWLTSHAE